MSSHTARSRCLAGLPVTRALSAALDLAARGFRVFPLWGIRDGKCACNRDDCGSPGKHPVISGWRDLATTDTERLSEWFGDEWLNVAIATGSGIIVVDEDHRKGGEFAMEELESQFDIPETLTVRTGFGQHRYFRVHGIQVANSVCRLGLGLDIRADGGYVVGPGSTHASGATYEWLDETVEIADAPPDLVKLLCEYRETDEISSASLERIIEAADLSMPRAERIRRAIAYTDRVPPAVQGDGGDAQTFSVALHVARGFCLPPQDTLEVLHRYNARCLPPWSDADLRHKLRYIHDKGRGDGPPWGFHLSMPIDPEVEVAPFEIEGDEVGHFASDVLAQDAPPIQHHPTGIKGLDGSLGGGLPTRALTVVASRSGAGKTGFAIGVGIEVAMAGEVSALYVSTELEGRECAMRAAAIIERLPHRDMVTGQISSDVAKSAVKDLRLRVIGYERFEKSRDPVGDLGKLVGKISESEGKPPVLILDYLQMASIVSDNLRQGISRTASLLRKLAQDRDCAVLAVSSTARSYYRQGKDFDSDDPVSYLAAAKESGDIEFAAANVVFLDVQSKPREGIYSARIVVAKARRGQAGFVGAALHGPTGRWSESDLPTPEAKALKSETENAIRRGRQRRALLIALRDKGDEGLTSRACRDVIGGDRKSADALRSELVSDGLICTAEVEYLDSAGRKRTGARFVLTSNGFKHLESN